MAIQQPRNDNVPPKGLRAVAQAGEPHRGRQAESPSEIPPSGWKDIILRVYQNIGKHRVIALAAGVAFYALLAIFPAIAALVAIYGFFADPATISSHLDSVAGLLPGGAMDVIRDQMSRIASHGKSTLGLTFAFGLGVSLWSANAGIKAIFDALNPAEKQGRCREAPKLKQRVLAQNGRIALPIIFQFQLGARRGPVCSSIAGNQGSEQPDRRSAFLDPLHTRLGGGGHYPRGQTPHSPA
jgi:hypothetical protein